MPLKGIIWDGKKLAKMDLFATPDSIEALQSYVYSMSASERMVALTIMGMTWNLCAELTKEKS